MTYLTIITSTNDDLCNYSCGLGLGLLCHGSAPNFFLLKNQQNVCKCFIFLQSTYIWHNYTSFHMFWIFCIFMDITDVLKAY